MRGPQPGAEQLSLDGIAPDGGVLVPDRQPGKPDALGYKLFVAAFPEPDDARRIGELGRRLMREHRLRNCPQAEDRLHVTLCSIADYAETVPRAVTQASVAVARGLSCPALPLVFDRAQSFSADGAFVLGGDAATDAAVARLRRPLMTGLRRCGLKPGESRNPHMTVVYHCGQWVEQHRITPLAWTVRRFALVLSHVGNTHHQLIEQWRLPQH